MVSEWGLRAGNGMAVLLLTSPVVSSRSAAKGSAFAFDFNEKLETRNQKPLPVIPTEAQRSGGTMHLPLLLNCVAQVYSLP
ncbi:MAG: hypothetical protein JWO20_497 [Candidatus Angelobacter sp.]|jgi:hypothetical protein|nr:hypothetical protein [Candidatus Angelobacter sp.]